MAETSEQGALAPQRDLTAQLESIDSMPLFMKKMPSDTFDPDEKGNLSALDALQSLTFDGTPDEVALGFKTQGNDYYIGKRYVEARGFYTQALNAQPTDESLRETLLVNRAACNLVLENHGQVLKDCSEALALNPRSIKAFFRSAKSLNALKRFVEAIDCCDHAAQLDPSNKDIAALRKGIATRQEQARKRESQIEEQSKRKKELKLALDKAFLSRGLWVETSAKPPDNPSPPHFDPDVVKGTMSDINSSATNASRRWNSPDSIRVPLVFPVAFLYPQYAQSDLVSHFHEDTSIGDQLDVMFPADSLGRIAWDVRGEYVSKNLKVFATTHEKRLLRIGRKLSLREAIHHCARDAHGQIALKRDGMVLKDGVLSLIVLPEGTAEQEWIKRFKTERMIK